MPDSRKTLLDVAVGGNTNELVLNGVTYFLDNEIVGRGGSAIVYKGYYEKDNATLLDSDADIEKSKKPAIIKEIFPKELSDKLYRKPTGEISLIPSLSTEQKTDASNLFEFYKGRAERENTILERLQLDDDGRTIDTRLFDGKQFAIANNTVYVVLGIENGNMLNELIDVRSTETSSDLSTFAGICEYTMRILEALRPLHDKGYLHLDIKPDNVHIEKYDTGGKRRAKLIDFNSAFNPTQDNADFFTFTYSSGYSAPELESESKSKTTLSAATDLYSVAAVFFYLLKNRVVKNFDYEDKAGWMLTNESQYCSELSAITLKKCNEIIAKGIEPSQKYRYKTIECFIKAMKELTKTIDIPTLTNNHKRPYEHFIGRSKEMADIDKVLTDDNYVYLEGMGGIGKSELSKHYAWLHQKKYDIVQFVTFKEDLFTTIAANLQFDNFDYEKYEEAYGDNNDEKAKRIFADKMAILQRHDKGTLIIIDNYNVDADDNFHRLISGKYRVILTSREKHEGSNFVEIKSMETMEDLLALFKEYYGRDLSTALQNVDISTIQEIIDLVLGHTMTVMMIASTMRKNNTSPTEMLERLKESLDPQLQKAIAVNKEEIPAVVREQVMYTHMQNLFNMEQFDADEDEEYRYYEVMTNMALIPYKGMDKRQFLHWTSRVRYEYESDPEVEAAIEYDVGDYAFIDRLIQLRWIQFDKSNNLISLHPVVSEVAYKELKPNCEVCGCLIDGFSENASSSDKKTYIDHNNYLDMINLAYKRLTEPHHHIFGLCLNLSITYSTLNKYDDALECCYRALEIAESVEVEDEYVNTVHGMIAMIKHSLGIFDEASQTISNYEQRVDRPAGTRKPLSEYEDKSKAYVTYVMPHIQKCMQAKILGQYDKALMYSDEILEMFVELYGNDYNPEIALALKQRGTIFDDMGELDKALELYFSGLEMYSHFHPDDEYGKSTYHADIGHVYSKLARVDPSKITEAENYMKRALAPLEERDGAMDSQVIKMKYNMGMMYLQMEQIGDARQYLLDALDAQKIIYKANPYHEDIGNSTQYIGACYAQEDDHENALKYYEEALAIFRKTYEFSGSDNHKHMFELFTNSSISYMQVGNRAKALEYVTAAFNIANNIYSENSIDMAGAYENMGMLRYILGIERKAALENFERSMKISLMYYPPNHPQITAIQEVVDELRTMVLREDNIASEAKAYTDIAKESLSLENLSKALECFEKSLLLYESQHGEIHPTIAVTCNEIGFIHDRLKNTEEAFRYYNRALSVCESSSDGKNPFKATLCGNIGGIHHEKGSFVEALKWYHKSLELFESIRGNNHVDTANTYFTIARCHDDAVSDIDTIVSWFLKAKDAYSSVFGEGSSQVKAMYHAISNVYKRAGDNEKAQEYAQLSR